MKSAVTVPQLQHFGLSTGIRIGYARVSTAEWGLTAQREVLLALEEAVASSPGPTAPRPSPVDGLSDRDLASQHAPFQRWQTPPATRGPSELGLV